jgi:hypothetical protein
MKIEAIGIEKVDLPNYLETISWGDQSMTREAPLLGKFRVDLRHNNNVEELFFEVREQPHGPLISEYYEDQIYEVAGKIALTQSGIDTGHVYNKIMNVLTPLVFEFWKGNNVEFPFVININT